MISVGIAEDQALFRRGIVGLINTFSRISIVEEVENGQELLDKYAEIVNYGESIPEITILDLNMPVLDGIKTTELLKENYPDSKIIIVTSFDDPDIIVHLYEKGANAYLDKNAEPEEVELAINSVSRNEFYFNRAAKNALESSKNKSKNPLVLHEKDRLSDREFEVLRHLCYEKSNEEIAELMNVSKRTIEGHRQKLLQKTGAKNTTGLVLFALKSNLINISEIKVSPF